MFDPKVNIDRGQQISEEDSKKRYQEEQKQRALERTIRETRREIAGFNGSGLDTEAIKEQKRKLRMKLQEQSDYYMEYCKSKNLKPRNFSLQIGHVSKDTYIE